MNQLANNPLGGLHERKGLSARILLRSLLLSIIAWWAGIIWKPDISKAQRLIGHEPKHRITVGLDETMDRYAESLK